MVTPVGDVNDVCLMMFGDVSRFSGCKSVFQKKESMTPRKASAVESYTQQWGLLTSMLSMAKSMSFMWACLGNGTFHQFVCWPLTCEMLLNWLTQIHRRGVMIIIALFTYLSFWFGFRNAFVQPCFQRMPPTEEHSFRHLTSHEINQLIIS